jgi:hypothetical protein
LRLSELREQYRAVAVEKGAAEVALEVAPAEAGLSREELESCVQQLGNMAETPTSSPRSNPGTCVRPNGLRRARVGGVLISGPGGPGGMRLR